jgi:hypothetical protein
MGVFMPEEWLEILDGKNPMRNIIAGRLYLGLTR